MTDLTTITNDNDSHDVFDDDMAAWIYAENYPWVAYSNDHGDWWALRPATEDDPPAALAAGGVCVRLDTIEYPWVVVATAPAMTAATTAVIGQKQATTQETP